MESKSRRGERLGRTPNRYARLLQDAGIPQMPDDLLAAMQGDRELSPQDEHRADAVINAACCAIRSMLASLRRSGVDVPRGRV